MIEWAERLDASGLISLPTYRAKNAITTLLPRLRGDNAGLATMYMEPKAIYLQLWPSVFKRRAPETTPFVEEALGGPIKQRQRIRSISDPLLDALTSAYQEADGRSASPSGHKGHGPQWQT